MELKLSDPITKAPLVGAKYRTLFEKLGLTTIADLLHHYPHRYCDYRRLVKIASLSNQEENLTVQGKVSRATNLRTRTGKVITRVYLDDETGRLEAIWFNQPYLLNTLKEGVLVNLSGRLSKNYLLPQMISPEFEVIKGERSIHTACLVPIYPETKGLSSKRLRAVISRVLNHPQLKLEDHLPEEILRQYHLLPLPQALHLIHLPNSDQELKLARRRLAFDELLKIQLRALIKKKEWASKGPAPVLSLREKNPRELATEFQNCLPFKLTSAQKRAIKEILLDLNQKKPMNRLLEGDVGSGKTVVAAAAVLQCIKAGHQAVLMAPTEVLARQHFASFKELLSPFNLKTNLHTSSEKITSTSPNLIIGTHALLYDRVKFNRVGLVIIDEQHRFGVNQRAKLIKKASRQITPHLLTMTATPIPRTMALTLYGDLDLSILDEMPPGRRPVKTFVVPPSKRRAGEDWIRAKIAQENAQLFVICPLIEESEKLQVKAATEEFRRLKTEVFPSFKVGLLHGQLKSAAKQQVIQAFARGELHILVSTSVVEVGIDIPRASLMVIEGAERFGLAQLHQLRGRVGRSETQAYCFLFTNTTHPKVLKRLKALENSNDGFFLAELDLKTRGPGEIYGLKQSGIPQLRIATLCDTKLMTETREAAQKIIRKNLTDFPNLEKWLKSKHITDN